MPMPLQQEHPVRRCVCPTALLLLLVHISALAACGRSSGSRASLPLTTTPAPNATSVVPSQAVRLTTADGATLSGTLYGQGTQAVILSNEGDNNSAPWRPVAQLLAAQG